MANSFTHGVPLADKILLRKIESTGEQKRGGLIIPDVARKESHLGEVLAVGRGAVIVNTNQTLLPEVQPGDRVVVSKYNTGSEVRIGEEDLLIVPESEILFRFARDDGRERS